eukprot:m.44245 g.44245  ORF g.44245 m.44245 type:complete len:327 (-) comp10592_c0_seq1:1140-2120(-)
MMMEVKLVPAVVSLLVLFVCFVSIVEADTGVCGGNANYNGTFCDADSTCCQYHWSPNGYGCCTMPNAVCCDNGYTCCPSGTTCHDSGPSWSVTTQCLDSSGKDVRTGEQICKIGIGRPFESGKKSCLIIGDSVSIGYTPFVATQLADVCDVQHSPYSGDGGACETAYGEQCLKYFLQSSSGHKFHADLIMFNWGLHNIVTNGSVVPGQSGYAKDYIAPLRNITHTLATKTNATLLFAITSPELCSVTEDATVQSLNNQAVALMKEYSIPTVDLHSAIVNKCGPPPQQSCFGLKGCWCPHCPPGYEWLAESTISPAIRSLLNAQESE